MEVNWLDLPEEITDNIARRLTDIDDYVRFGFVCKTWQSIVFSHTTKEKNWNRFSPLLLLPENENNTDQDQADNNHVRKFFSLSSKKIVNVNLPEIQRSRCFGSPFGWLFTVGLDLNIHLMNPFTHCQVTLPSQPMFQNQYDIFIEPGKLRRMFVTKFALLSSKPHSKHGCVVMAIYSKYSVLAFARPGDKTWTPLDCPKESHKDIYSYNGQFYAISSNGILRICEIDTPHPRTIDFMPPPAKIKPWEMFYLVGMSGDLHLVVRLFDTDEDAPEGIYRCKAEYFEVYKLDFHSKKWIELSDLGDYALFVGTNTSFAISTSGYPGLKRNSVYFTDDTMECYKSGGGRDMGIFDFQTKNFTHFYAGSDILSSFSPPLFFVPSWK
ncbi:hypothetical protein AQUCO_02000235v1 [Aquilegia coerulea]|uniref:F-box domain-containing protein n=1 Tax=Aquilegia coerulea TaxID=218851 RepID=A0A2G5DHD9_AQUCA|nr:hypothetical protein AQUCO_02000235v1 [Aquilegia coerulea]